MEGGNAALEPFDLRRFLEIRRQIIEGVAASLEAKRACLAREKANIQYMPAHLSMSDTAYRSNLSTNLDIFRYREALQYLRLGPWAQITLQYQLDHCSRKAQTKVGQGTRCDASL